MGAACRKNRCACNLAIATARLDLASFRVVRSAMTILSGHATLAGVIGWPVTHSRSPRLHGYWLRHYEIDGAYVPLSVRPEDFRDAVRGLRAAGFAGANVTVPHKQAAFALCDEVSDFARRAGAVNTIVLRDGRIVGSNTDGFGFTANLRAHGVDPQAGPALVLGAGGAARAIVAALLDEGVRVTIANRTRERADELAQALTGVAVCDWHRRSEALADHALVVNASTAGMNGVSPLELDLTRAPSGMAVADIVYVPLETPLLAAASAAGLRAVEGLGMLLHQGRPGFAAWFGVMPDVDDELYRFVAADLL
jgi:shikimate dehydrogenase